MLEIDFLRLVSMLAVIAIHVSSTYLSSQTKCVFLGMNLAFLLNQAARFSVPMFLLLSGFSLGQKKKAVSWLSFLRERSRRILPSYLFWVLLYAFANTGFDLSTWTSRLVAPLWLLEELLTGRGAPHLYFIPLIFQCYLLYPFLKRWVDRAPAQSAAWALVVTFLLQGGVLLGNWNLLPFHPSPYLWMLFPTWSFYFVIGMCLHHLDFSVLRARCRELTLPLLTGAILFACLYSALAHRLGILHAVRPSLLVGTLLAFFLWPWSMGTTSAVAGGGSR